MLLKLQPAIAPRQHGSGQIYNTFHNEETLSNVIFDRQQRYKNKR